MDEKINELVQLLSTLVESNEISQETADKIAAVFAEKEEEKVEEDEAKEKEEAEKLFGLKF